MGKDSNGATSRDDATLLTSESIASVAALAVAGERAKLINASEREPGDVYFVLKPGGVVERVVAEPGPIDDQLDSPAELRRYLDTLAAMIASSIAINSNITDEKLANIKAAAPVVYVHENGVKAVFVYAGRGRQNVAKCPLTKTLAYEILLEMCGEKYSGQEYTQVDLYRLLRVDLADALPAGSNLPKIVREMQFETVGTTSGTVSQEMKALGVNITNTIRGGVDIGTIPERFEVTINLFEEFVEPVRITIDLDTNPQRRTLRLTPLPGQLERALAHTLEKVRQVFSDGTTTKDDFPSFIVSRLDTSIA